MNYWFIVHSRESYNEREDLVGFTSSRKDPKKPHLNAVNEMRPGDYIIYYMKRPHSAILGIFKIVEKLAYSFYEEWDDSPFQFRIEKLIASEENPIPIQELIPKLKFFEGIESIRSWPNKLRVGIQEITETDCQTIENLLRERSQPPIEPSPPLEKPTPHVQMIQASHDLAQLWDLISYVGKQEQKAVLQEVGEGTIEDLPEWLANIAKEIGEERKISQIDNIWFMQEKGNFLIPVVAFEHERSRQDRAILDRFSALRAVLNANHRFRNISPSFVVVVPDSNSDEQYFESKLEKDGKWKAFARNCSDHCYILSLKDVIKRSNDFLLIINQSTSRNKYD